MHKPVSEEFGLAVLLFSLFKFLFCSRAPPYNLLNLGVEHSHRKESWHCRLQMKMLWAALLQRETQRHAAPRFLPETCQTKSWTGQYLREPWRWLTADGRIRYCVRFWFWSSWAGSVAPVCCWPPSACFSKENISTTKGVQPCLSQFGISTYRSPILPIFMLDSGGAAKHNIYPKTV